MYFSSWLASYGLVGECGNVCCSSKQLRQSSGVWFLRASPVPLSAFIPEHLQRKDAERLSTWWDALPEDAFLV